MRRARRLGISGALLGCMLVMHPSRSSVACDNPVFRYALENWTAENFELLLVQAGELTDDEQSAWEHLEKAIAATSLRPNLQARLATPNDAALEDESGSRELAQLNKTRLCLVTPQLGGRRKVVWSGDCTMQNAERILHSPARTEIARRLLASEAIVWVWLAAPEDPALEDAQAVLKDFITTYLATIEEAAAAAAGNPLAKESLPGQEPKPPIDKSAFWPPRFSVLVVDPNDPAEEVLIAMLRTSAPKAVPNTPLVFPVFGRGRVLGGLAASDLTVASLRSACDFLTGACSCEVKERNPGDDLLLTADWSSVAKDASAEGRLTFLALEPEAQPSATPETPDQDELQVAQADDDRIADAPPSATPEGDVSPEEDDAAAATPVQAPPPAEPRLSLSFFSIGATAIVVMAIAFVVVISKRTF